jgi:hypothetical protein
VTAYVVTPSSHKTGRRAARHCPRRRRPNHGPSQRRQRPNPAQADIPARGSRVAGYRLARQAADLLLPSTLEALGAAGGLLGVDAREEFSQVGGGCAGGLAGAAGAAGGWWACGCAGGLGRLVAGEAGGLGRLRWWARELGRLRAAGTHWLRWWAGAGG